MSDEQMSRSLLVVRRAIGLGVILLGAAPTFAEGGHMSAQVQVGPIGDSSTLARASGTAISETATGHLRKRFPRLEIGKTALTPVNGIVVVKVGGDYVYLTEDGRHAFVGTLVDLETGVNGTPAIVMPDGQMQPGYLPADRLIVALGLKKQSF